MRTPHFMMLAATAALLLVPTSAFAQGALDELEKLIDESPPPAIEVPLRPDAPVTELPGDAADKAPVIVPEPHTPGYLGVMVDERSGIGGGGVVITDVRPDSPAAAARLSAGDEIVSINGRVTRQLEDMASVLNRTSPGDRVELEVRRGGRTMHYELALIEPPERLLDPVEDDLAIPLGDELADRPITPRFSTGPLVLGITVCPLQSRRFPLLGLHYQSGVMIESIVSGSPADVHGLPRGAELIAIDGYRVRHPDEVRALVQSSNPAQPLEVAFRLGGRSYRQLIPLTEQAAAAMPRTVSPDADVRVPALADDPRDVAKPPVADPTAKEIAELKRLEDEVTALRSRAQQLEDRLNELRRGRPDFPK